MAGARKSSLRPPFDERAKLLLNLSADHSGKAPAIWIALMGTSFASVIGAQIAISWVYN